MKSLLSSLLYVSTGDHSHWQYYDTVVYTHHNSHSSMAGSLILLFLLTVHYCSISKHNLKFTVCFSKQFFKDVLVLTILLLNSSTVLVAKMTSIMQYSYGNYTTINLYLWLVREMWSCFFALCIRKHFVIIIIMFSKKRHASNLPFPSRRVWN